MHRAIGIRLRDLFLVPGPLHDERGNIPREADAHLVRILHIESAGRKLQFRMDVEATRRREPFAGARSGSESAYFVGGSLEPGTSPPRSFVSESAAAWWLDQESCAR